MLEFIVVAAIVIALPRAWYTIIRPALRYVVVSRQLSTGIFTLQECTFCDNEETIRGSIRKLSQSEANVYRKYVIGNARYFAIFKYGADTDIRIQEVRMENFADPVPLWHLRYEAFDLRRPKVFFDTTYPFNESRTCREFAHLILRREDRWKVRPLENAL